MDNFNLKDQEETIHGVISIDDTSQKDKDFQEPLPKHIPVLTLKNTVLFPFVHLPISVSREHSKAMVLKVQKEEGLLAVVAQKSASEEKPTAKDIHTVGVLAKIVKIFHINDDTTMVVLQAMQRISIEITAEQPHLTAQTKYIAPEIVSAKKAFQKTCNDIKNLALDIISEGSSTPEASLTIRNLNAPHDLLNFICTHLNQEVSVKQDLLLESSLNKRANQTIKLLSQEYKSLILKKEIQEKVKDGIDEQQREYFLNQQLKTIQDELGGQNATADVDAMKKEGEKKRWGKEVKEVFSKELDRLGRMNPNVADYQVQRNFLETLLDLPFNIFTQDNYNLQRAKRILNKDHFGLDEVKDRVLEFLAVLKLKQNMKSPILCLYGPPGVGKTSLGKSIAKSLGRKYIRLSLGGMRDESEIKGHRKTYIGSMPGRIIQSLKRVKSANPVFLLDEIDKISRDRMGDPSSTLLEVLDPEQNNAFLDNFIEVPFDLSKVMFVATANSLATIQPALLDRMEIIEINGYTTEEKIEIAKRHLFPKQLQAHGLEAENVSISKKLLRKVVSEYTRESGVRGLDKTLGKIARKLAKHKALSPKKALPKLTEDIISEFLGAALFLADTEENNEIAGVVNGLAWTSVGGEMLKIESSFSAGNGKLHVTGNLGDVMKESMQIAFHYLKSNAVSLSLEEKLFAHNDFYLHVPQGGVPKDGPSAGITILTALVSLITQKRVKHKLAMTGEITLRGKVLPVGGIKEKILAAKRAGMREIILSKQNTKDVEKIDKHYIKGLKFHFVENMSDVISFAITDIDVKDPKYPRLEKIG